MRAAGALLAILLLAISPVSAADSSKFPPVPTESTVVSVYDGDTFTLETGDKVRVSGVNTPELRPLEPFGIEARDATKAFVLEKTVELVYGDVKRDSYGRLLAYVRVDGMPLEEMLVAEGLGHVFLIPPVGAANVERLLALQEEAKANHRGIWNVEGYQSTLHMTSFHANGNGDDAKDPNSEYLRVCNLSTEPINVDGYTIENATGERFGFPNMVVPAGYTVKIHSGRGVTQSDPNTQLEIYLGSDKPIWNNGFDNATIYDAHGQVVDTRVHKVKSPTR